LLKKKDKGLIEMNNKPVAWIAYDEFGDFMLEATKEGDYPWQPLYTTPQTKPLSDEEIIEIRKQSTAFGYKDWSDSLSFARAIEERHGIR